MAVTGTGTQADPFIVHSYSEFISLSGHSPVADSSVYIKWFDSPNQVLDCNAYGSEFKWGTFTDNAGISGTVTFHIDLNGCTIKNFLIADGVTMFEGHYYSINGNLGKIIISNGSIRNVFLGSATSKFCGDYVKFQDVSISFNFAGATATPFKGNGNVTFDNCAMYLVGSTLTTGIMGGITLTDTDIELHITNQNKINMFPSCSFTDCRVQGKVSGDTPYYSDSSIVHHTVLGAITGYYDGTPITNWVNCVVDLDLTESTAQRSDGKYYIIYAYSGGINTNVMCKSHLPSNWSVPTNWNYMTHEQIRNGEYLNSKGFTVVEVVEG